MTRDFPPEDMLRWHLLEDAKNALRKYKMCVHHQSGYINEESDKERKKWVDDVIEKIEGWE